MLESAVKAYPNEEIGIHVVWVPMLGSDNKAAAVEISSMFDDRRVRQYWDPNRRVGIAYARNLYPSYLKNVHKGMKAVLPADHMAVNMLQSRVDAPPEKAPLWDVAFTYNQGSTWGEIPPKPLGMVKQIMFYGGVDDGPTGMFFTDFGKQPFDTDWIIELAKGMEKLIGKPPKPDNARKTNPIEVVSLAESVEPLRAHFNAHKDKNRFVALLSPT